MRRWGAFLLLLVSLILPGKAVMQAQEEIRIIANTQEIDFPNAVRFLMEAEGASPITQVRLSYRLGSQPARSAAYPTFTPGTKVSATFTLETRGRNYIPPGTEITFSYQIADEVGNRLETDLQRMTYHDTRFRWNVLTQGPLSVHYHDMATSRAQRILEVAAGTIAQMGEKLGVRLTQPTKVVVYNTVREMEAALPLRSETTRRQLITEGQAYAQYDLVLVLGQDPEALSHEVTHLLVHLAAEGPYAQIPSWVNEGLAVYAQREAGEYRIALARALQQDRLLLLRGMESQPGLAEDIILFYGQSFSTVKYLIDTYGWEKMRAFLGALKEGKGTEGALQATYGFGVDGLEAQWRQAVGAPPRKTAAPGTAETTPTPIPTLVPFGAVPASPPGAEAPTPGPGRPPPQQGAPGGGFLESPAFYVAVGGLFLVVLLLGAGVFVWALLRRSS